MTEENENSTYCCINLSEIYIPRQIKEQTICIESDIGDVLKRMGINLMATNLGSP